MPAKIKNEYGNIFIEEGVLESIAGNAAIECYGLVGMANKGAKDGLVELLKRENLRKGVKVTICEENKINIDLYIVVQYGVSISTVATNIIERVKYTVEKITEIEVFKVNVNIQGVRAQN